MTTEYMEVWSLEEGDQITINGDVYKILEIGIDTNGDDYLLFVVDEDGYRHTISAAGSKKFRLVLDTTDAVV